MDDYGMTEEQRLTNVLNFIVPAMADGFSIETSFGPLDIDVYDAGVYQMALKRQIERQLAALRNEVDDAA